MTFNMSINAALAVAFIVAAVFVVTKMGRGLLDKHARAADPAQERVDTVTFSRIVCIVLLLMASFSAMMMAGEYYANDLLFRIANILSLVMVAGWLIFYMRSPRFDKIRKKDKK